MKKILTLCVSTFLFFFFAAQVHAFEYTNYVNDYANVLTPQQEQKLNERLSAYDKETTNQIAIAIIQSLAGDTVENFSIHLADQWKPGQKGKDNGVLMVFAMNEHKMRIEIGRGLEGQLTDPQAKHILDDVIKPEFKNGKYYEGIDQGITALIQDVSPDRIATVSAASSSEVNSSAGFIFILAIIVFIIVAAVILNFMESSSFSSSGSSSSYSGGSSGYYGGISSSSSSGFFGGSSSDGSDSGSDSDSDSGSSGFGGFGGGSFSGGGASSSW